MPAVAGTGPRTTATSRQPFRTDLDLTNALCLRCSRLLMVIALLTAPAPRAEEQVVGVPGVRGGVVATSEPAAARVGATVLTNGGNAIDAAVAVAFALNVVEPQSSGIGGGGFMMVYLARSGETFIIDSRERAPAAADPTMFLDAKGHPFPYPIRSTSGVAIGVPGMIRGAARALRDWGTVSWAEALEPAIDLAQNGIRVSSRLAQSVLDPRLRNESGNPAYEEARKVFHPGGVPLRENDLLVQPELATTFRLLARQGPEAFYRGALAEAVIATQSHARTVDNPADIERLQGRMVMADLARYAVVVRQPVTGSYRGFRIASMPPPSSGGLTVLQILKLIERFPLADRDQGFGAGSVRTLNVMLEAMRLAFADRAMWIGDNDFVPVPSTGLLHEDYIRARSALIDPDARRPTVAAGDPRPFDNSTMSGTKSLAASHPVDDEGRNTTHFTVVDEQGNMVSFTNTIESAWGTGLMVPGFGFLLNNELTDFNSKPARNADPGAFNPGANDAAPYKRPRSSMAPTMVFRQGRPIAAYGSPGGPTIINSVVNITVNLIDHQLNVQEAIDAPRISQSTANGEPVFESGFPRPTIARLNDLGHGLRDDRMRVIGSVQAIVLDPRGERRFGGADRRRIGAVISLPRAETVRVR